MRILFINGSPNRNGNTAALAKELLKGKAHETVDLVDYKIYSCGQDFPDDQFDEVYQKMKAANVLVMGSPVYWHSMTGAFRTLLDRLYGIINSRDFGGKDLYFLYQGAGPSKKMMDAGDYTMGIFCQLNGMNYKGMITTRSEAAKTAGILE